MSMANDIDTALQGDLAAFNRTLGQRVLHALKQLRPARAKLTSSAQPRSKSPIRSENCSHLAFEFGAGRLAIFEMNAQKNYKLRT